MTAALEIRDLVLRYGPKTAVAGVSLQAEAGRITAIVGPNGAGKTSIIETCEGYHKPTSGSVRVLGLDPRSDARALRPRVGVMLQEGGVPSGAKAMAALNQMAALYRHPADTIELGRRLGLAGIRAPYRRMSGGEQQRLKFAIALVGRPEFVFLDEPTAGLDAAGKHVVWDLVSDLRRCGVTIVLSTHLMDDVERLADRVIVVEAGRVVAAGTPDELLGSPDDGVQFEGPLDVDLQGLRAALPTGADVVQAPPGTYRITGAGGPRVLAIVTTWCADQGFMPRGLATGRRRLEDVIVELTSSTDQP